MMTNVAFMELMKARSLAKHNTTMLCVDFLEMLCKEYGELNNVPVKYLFSLRTSSKTLHSLIDDDPSYSELENELANIIDFLECQVCIGVS